MKISSNIRDAASVTGLLGIAAAAGQIDAAMLARPAHDAAMRLGYLAAAMGCLAVGTVAAAYACGILLVHGFEAYRRLEAL